MRSHLRFAFTQLEQAFRRSVLWCTDTACLSATRQDAWYVGHLRLLNTLEIFFRRTAKHGGCGIPSASENRVRERLTLSALLRCLRYHWRCRFTSRCTKSRREGRWVPWLFAIHIYIGTLCRFVSLYLSHCIYSDLFFSPALQILVILLSHVTATTSKTIKLA
jgi:hypothetical protein